MDEKKRLLKNTGIIAIGNLSTKLVSFFLLPMYTSLLSTSEYGIVDYIISISTFCVPFISFLMDESMFRFLIDCKNDKEKSKVISASLLIIIKSCIVTSLIAVPVLLLIKYEYTFYVVLYILTSVLSTMISALLRGIGRTDKYAVYNFLSSSMKILLNVVLIAGLHLGIEGMLLASIISHIIVPVWYIIKEKIWKYIDFRNSEKELSRNMIKYSVPLIPNKLSWSIINLSDRLIIMNVIGSDASGLYAVAYKFPNLMDTVYGFFYQSWKESSARALKDNSPEKFYNSIYTYLKDFMFSVSLLMTAFMPLAFRLLIAGEFQKSIVYVPILLFATYFANISGFYGGIFTAHKDTKIMGTSTVASAIINIIVNFAMIETFGLYAAAVSTFVANFIVYIYRKIKVKKYVALDENIFRQIVSVVVTAVVLVLFYINNLYTIAGGCIVSVAYALYANKKMIMQIFSAIGKKGGKSRDK